MKIAILAGDGIGPEIIAQAVQVLELLNADGLKRMVAQDTTRMEIPCRRQRSGSLAPPMRCYAAR